VNTEEKKALKHSDLAASSCSISPDSEIITPIPVFDTILIRFAVAMATACGCCFLVPVFATMFITIVTSRDNGYVTCRETLTMDGQWLWVHAEDNKKDIR